MTQHITLTGNVTGDPELRFTTTGEPVANFTVAVNDRFRDKDGEWKDGDTYFQRVAAWGELGENVAASVTRGSRVLVQGRMSTRQYDNDKFTDAEGKAVTQYAHELRASEVAVSLRWAEAKITRADRSRAESTVGAGSKPDAWAAGPSSTTEPPF